MSINTEDIEVIASTIGYSKEGDYYNIFNMCVYSGVNKWSKYKPIRDAGVGANWPGGSDSKYGFNLPTDWTYNKPRGGSPGGSPDEPARPTDFKGYEHDKTLSFPSIQCRDTDNTFKTDLYPSGTASQFQQAIALRAYRTASDVIILPSDLGMDNYYAGLKIVHGGATWYKTMCQVHDLNFTGSTSISFSTEITDWSGSPAFANFPGDAENPGEATWTLFLSSAEAAAWTNSQPAGYVEFPTDTDGTNNFVKSATLTVHDWIKLEDYSLTFLGPASYQEVTVYCSTDATPAFSIADDAAWITLAVYDGATLISNPDLYLTGMKVRVSCSELSTSCIIDCLPEMREGETDDWFLSAESGELDGAASRHGHVTVTSDSQDAVIEVTQGNAGSDQLTFRFTVSPDSESFPASDVPMDVWITRGANTVYTDNSGAKIGRMGFSKEYTVTINETGIPGETYTVHLRIH